MNIEVIFECNLIFLLFLSIKNLKFLQKFFIWLFASAENNFFTPLVSRPTSWRLALGSMGRIKDAPANYK